VDTIPGQFLCIVMRLWLARYRRYAPLCRHGLSDFVGHPEIAFRNDTHGAKIDAWNHKNTNDWTPLRTAESVHRGMNLRRSPETAAALRKIMTEAGVSTEVEPEKVISGATK
jgi:hypothetical protein